jgi:hypothetical protein
MDLSSLPEVWELPQDQMAEAASVLTWKAAHDGKAERQNYDRGSLVENLRHGERALLYEDLRGDDPFSLSCAHHLSARSKVSDKTPGLGLKDPLICRVAAQ